MGDSVHFLSSNKHQEVSRRKLTQSQLATPLAKISDHFKSRWLAKGNSGQIVPFLLKVAALEIVRRLSRKKCPMVWKVVQWLQLITYPPFKWIGRWKLLRALISRLQNISRPILFLSIATTFSDLSESLKSTSDHMDDCQQSTVTPVTSESRVPSETSESEDWLVLLRTELDRQGMHIPERIDDKELRRFYAAANGDFPCLLWSVRRTIRWRESYGFMTLQELEPWSHLVFWHGSDLELQPCLVVRLGLACSSLVPQDRPRFIQAVVSQVERGLLHLLIGEDKKVTVLMDCQGLSTTNVPLQMIKACSTIMQDHYQNCLAAFYVLRLPHSLGTMVQTLIQDLNPRTRQKIHYDDDANMKNFSEILKLAPSVLGGNCTCSTCEGPLAMDSTSRKISETVSNLNRIDACLITATSHDTADAPGVSSCDHVLRTAILGLLVLCVLVAFLSGMDDTGTLSLL